LFDTLLLRANQISPQNFGGKFESASIIECQHDGAFTLQLKPFKRQEVLSTVRAELDFTKKINKKELKD
jgi:hypothetical protein